MDILALSRLGRFRDIVAVLFKYGFDDVAERLQLPGKLLIRRTRVAAPEMNTWERLRRTLEELGPTFVKFGQILSLRGDLLPAGPAPWLPGARCAPAEKLLRSKYPRR